MTKMLPCAHCGSLNVRVDGAALYAVQRYVGCEDCGISTGLEESRKDAIAAWNRRAKPAPQREGEK